MTNAEVGNRIRTRREFLGLTQSNLADRLGVKPSAVSQYESGKRGLDAADLARMAEILEAPVGYFFGEGDQNANDVPPELQMVYEFQGKVYQDLPPGHARESYLNALRANAAAARSLVGARLEQEEDRRS